MKQLIIILILILIIACGKDDAHLDSIRLSYPEGEINITFRTKASITPSIIDWNGNSGFYGVSSSTEILQRDQVVFDSLTGSISWDKNFPVGTYDFTVTAKNS